MSLLSVMWRPICWSCGPMDQESDGAKSSTPVGNEAFMTSNRFYKVDDKCV